MYYYLAPWEWDTSEPSAGFWRAPLSTVGLVDLRPLPAQARAGGTPEGFGFFATKEQLPTSAGVMPLGQDLNSSLTVVAVRAVESRLGLSAGDLRYSASSVLRMLWDALVYYGDPTGQTRWKPLMPSRRWVGGALRLVLELHLGGHSLVYSEPFRWGIHPSTDLVAGVLREGFARLKRQDRGLLDWRAIANRPGWDHYRRVLGAWERKYGVPASEIVPGETAVNPATVITDGFTRGDSADLGSSSEGWAWTEGFNGFAIASNQATETDVGARIFARAESQLSDDDHFAEIDVVSHPTTDNVSYHGPCVRVSGFTFASNDENFYTGGIEGWTDRSYWIDKWVSGTRTALWEVGAASPGIASGLCKLDITGSNLELFVDTVSKVTGSDSAISGDLYTGFGGRRDAVFDDFQADDNVGAAATGSPHGGGGGGPAAAYVP